ncbi:hypothetical protein AAT17_11380 [Nonlabens sp. MIC269]|uniref:hypothetical protein n=1 Tax=Nonlabens sp. MIC269 TaxID=1476901 RepID=UPI000720D467|nr:hypothetical protein [Nonlabens sp. MIC269]ALM21793.1 hypothetical protein AAT17_11380 [Nonlabens sp. MIC269]
MAIRLGNTCGNCSNLNADNTCKIHEVAVSSSYTCNSFDMRADLNNVHDCAQCARFKSSSCPHPEKASAGMMCEAWAPEKVTA